MVMLSADRGLIDTPERFEAEFKEIKSALGQGETAFNHVAPKVVRLEDSWERHPALRKRFKGTFARQVRRELGVSAAACRAQVAAFKRFADHVNAVSLKSQIHPKAVLWLSDNVSDDKLTEVLRAIVAAYVEQKRIVVRPGKVRKIVRSIVGMPAPSKKPCARCAALEIENAELRRRLEQYEAA